jgi:hypothetical protein
MEFDLHGHVLIQPQEFQNRTFSDPNTLINQVLIPGTPHAFPTYHQYGEFLEYLAD